MGHAWTINHYQGIWRTRPQLRAKSKYLWILSLATSSTWRWRMACAWITWQRSCGGLSIRAACPSIGGLLWRQTGCRTTTLSSWWMTSPRHRPSLNSSNVLTRTMMSTESIWTLRIPDGLQTLVCWTPWKAGSGGSMTWLNPTTWMDLNVTCATRRTRGWRQRERTGKALKPANHLSPKWPTTLTWAAPFPARGMDTSRTCPQMTGESSQVSKSSRCIAWKIAPSRGGGAKSESH